jgi:hypothetical protein
MSRSVNKPVDYLTKVKLEEGTLPEGEGDFTGTLGGPDVSEFWKLGDTDFVNYKFVDGSNGFAIIGETWAIHVDNNNNMIFTSGAPQQGGCGGKHIKQSQGELTKTKSMSIHVTGRDDDGLQSTESDDSGNISEDKLPSYSLKIDGDGVIEVVGGELSLAGDVININGRNSVNITGKEVNIDAAGGSGAINMTASSVKQKSQFSERQTSAGEYIDGAPEVQTTQYNAAGSVDFNTPGDYYVLANGKLELSSSGNLDIVTNKSIIHWADDFLATYNGINVSKTTGQQKIIVYGEQVIEGGVNSTAALQLYAVNQGGFTQSIELRGDAGDILSTSKVGKFIAESGEGLSKIEVDKTKIDMVSNKTSTLTMDAAGVTIKGTKIYLN